MSTAPQRTPPGSLADSLHRLMAARMIGDLAEAERWRSRSEKERRLLEPLRGAGRRPIQERLRAILRCPAAHGGYQELIESLGRDGTQAYALASWDQFRAFLAHHRTSPYWRGLWAVHQFGGGYGGRVYLGAKIGCAQPDGRVALAGAAVLIGSTSEDSSAAAKKMAATCAEVRGLGPIDSIEMGFRPRPLSPALVNRRLEPGTLERMLGPELCTHPRGTWSLNETEDAALLSCPDCLRDRIACVPLHRLPPGHQLRAPLDGGTEAYLCAQAFYDQQERRATMTCLEDLARRDGVASLDPGAYANGRIRVQAPKGLRVGDLMNRR